MLMSQMEKDFRFFCKKKCRKIEWYHPHLVIGSDGEPADGRYCEMHAKLLAANDQSRYYVDDHSRGYSTCFFVGCSKRLYGEMEENEIKAVIEGLRFFESMSDQFASDVWFFMINDAFDRSAHWPKIKAHARRLMLEEYVPVVPDGILRFSPCDLHTQCGWEPYDPAWLSILIHIADMLYASDRSDCVDQMIEMLGGSYDSGGSFITGEDVPHAMLCKLFTSVGSLTERGDWLSYLSLLKPSDTIDVPDLRAEWPRNVFNVDGRRLKQPTLNARDSDALVALSGRFRFVPDRITNVALLSYELAYGFDDGSCSSWTDGITQLVNADHGERESTAEFFARVQKWIAAVLVPETEVSLIRLDRFRMRNRLRECVRDIFYIHDLGMEDALVKALERVDRGIVSHRIDLAVRDRYGDLMRWIDPEWKA